jgi:hypothetical protein
MHRLYIRHDRQHHLISYLWGDEMRVIKYYKKPSNPQIMKLDKIATEDVGVVKRGDLLVSYPIHLKESQRLSMWVRGDEVYIDWIREVA